MQLTSTLGAISILLNKAIADFESHHNVNTLCERVRNALFVIVEAFLVGKIEKTLRDPVVPHNLKVGAA